MIDQIFYIFLAVAGLGFLVFIHELGHFWIARREGMAVEVFSIGFGRPLYSWVKSGVRWQIGWLPFGGYVKIAGMQKEGNREPCEVANGFYSKRPIQRIRVALMGPLINLLFAFLAFSLLSFCGGRGKHFSEYTRRIGWVDPKSPLYQKGVRPGDVITSYDGRPFSGIKDLMIASIMKEDSNRIEGYKIDYLTGQRANFDYTLKTYQNPALVKSKESFSTIGVLTPAQYLIYDSRNNWMDNSSPMFGSGIESGDRVVWVDGEVVFSLGQLKSLINESTAFLTVRRGNSIFQTKVPRIHIDDLRMTAVQRAEVDDWQHEAGIRGRLQELYFIPYLFSPSGRVEMRLNFVVSDEQEKAFERCQRCGYFHPLEENDQIIAVDGYPVQSSYDLLQRLQQRHVQIIVQRNSEAVQKVSWKQADEDFERHLDLDDLHAIISSIGTSHVTAASGCLALLKPVVPQSAGQVAVSPDMRRFREQHYAALKQQIKSIRNPQQRQQQMKEWEASKNDMVLGLVFKDRAVIYNPMPVQQFFDVLVDTWRTLSGLFSGSVSPKYLSGPVGIVQVMHQGWEEGIKEALFWLAVISLNLGIVNLLPIPILDGGHIFFSLYEAVTKKRLSGNVMEKLVIPFAVLIVVFLVYLTFNDFARLFSKLF
jgi:regulator of sigma E protease